MSLRENTQAIFTACHRRYFGPNFHCAADDGAIAVVTIDDVGQIAGTVIDSSSGRPVGNARVGAQLKARGPTPDYYEKFPDSIEIEARIRIKTATGGDTPRNERDLAGRVFYRHGSPIARVRVSYNREKVLSGATDRMGVLPLKGLPRGPFSLSVGKDGYTPGWATIPAEAHEVELRY